MRFVPGTVLVLIGCMLFTCGGNRYVYQTRYMPRTSELRMIRIRAAGLATTRRW